MGTHNLRLSLPAFSCGLLRLPFSAWLSSELRAAQQVETGTFDIKSPAVSGLPKALQRKRYLRRGNVGARSLIIENRRGEEASYADTVAVHVLGRIAAGDTGSDTDPVPAGLFGAIHGLVCGGDEAFFVPGVVGMGCNAETGANGVDFSAFDFEAMVFKSGADSFGDYLGLVAAGVG